MLSTNRALSALFLIFMLCCLGPQAYAQDFHADKDQCHMNSEALSIKSFNHLNSKNLTNVVSDTISIYIECDYALYQKLGSSKDQCLAYVAALFLQVQEIYANAGIPLRISEIKVWEVQDPYDSQSAANALISFASLQDENFNGDLAHLLSGGSNALGGLAHLNGLCDRSKAYAFSNINTTLNTPMKYSWDVHVVAHEIGHNLGSPHTNDCIWGPEGNQAIDPCGSVDQACNNTDFPNKGGTIMSSCHSSPVGINFTLGIGQEPANLMKATIAECAGQKGTFCSDAIKITKPDTFQITQISQSRAAQHTDASNSMWYQYITLNDEMLSIGSCSQGVDTRLFVYKGNCQNLIDLGQSDDDCLSGSGFFYASKISNLSVYKGDTILIEWDDRWSQEGFNWYLQSDFVYEDICSNEIKDESEEGIDCGGTCEPCAEECDSLSPLNLEDITAGSYYSDTIVRINSTISAHATLTISTPISVEFLPGANIQNTGQLEIHLEDCRTQQARLGN